MECKYELHFHNICMIKKIIGDLTFNNFGDMPNNTYWAIMSFFINFFASPFPLNIGVTLDSFQYDAKHFV